MDARVLSTVSPAFLEGAMGMLQTVSPRSYRLGGGREEPDGSFSFLIRFIGREEAVTGELFIRFEEPRRPPPPPAGAEPEASAQDAEQDAAQNAGENVPAGGVPAEAAGIAPGAAQGTAQGAVQSAGESGAEPDPEPIPAPPPAKVPAQKIWLFEDLILEEPRSREAENSESRHRFDFPPYERFY